MNLNFNTLNPLRFGKAIITVNHAEPSNLPLEGEDQVSLHDVLAEHVEQINAKDTFHMASHTYEMETGISTIEIDVITPGLSDVARRVEELELAQEVEQDLKYNYGDFIHGAISVNLEGPEAEQARQHTRIDGKKVPV